MATYILKGVEMSDVGFGPESKKVRELARSLAKGTRPAQDAKESTKHWRNWKAGDAKAIDRYIKENAMLFFCEAKKLHYKFFTMDLEEVFGLILEYTYTAFQNYDPNNTAELVSYHCRYAQYYVSNTGRAWAGQDRDKIEIYKQAVKLRDDTGMYLRDCLIQVVKDRRKVKMCDHSSIVQRVEGLFNIFKGHTSLNKKVGFERDSDEVIDLISSGKPAIDIQVDAEDSKFQIQRIKRLLKKGLSREHKRVFDLALKGYKLERIAEATGVSIKTAKSRRDVVMKKVTRKAEKLKAKGIRLPAIF